MKPKILIFDVETAPSKGWFWGRFKQNIGANQVEEDGYMLCWCAKWLDSDEIMFDALPKHKRSWKRNKKDDSKIAKSLHKLLDEADIIVAHNGDRFDIPWANTLFIKHGLDPVNPAKTVDTLKQAKLRFRFPSNRLDEIGRFLELGRKVQHEGFDLWRACMSGDLDAWARMEEYNVQDVLLLEAVYLKLRPFMRNHPNVSVYDDLDGCPNCGSESYTKRGYYFTNLSRFQRYKCGDCGHNFRGKTNLNEGTPETRNAL